MQCRSLAATALSRTIPWKSFIATPNSAPSVKAPAKFSAWSLLVRFSKKPDLVQGRELPGTIVGLLFGRRLNFRVSWHSGATVLPGGRRHSRNVGSSSRRSKGGKVYTVHADRVGEAVEAPQNGHCDNKCTASRSDSGICNTSSFSGKDSDNHSEI